MKNKKSISYLVATIFIVVGIGIFAVAFAIGYQEIRQFAVTGYETNTYEVSETFDDIVIQTSTLDIVFILSEEDACKVVCFEPEKLKHEVSVRDGVLSIKEKDDRKWYEHISLFSVSSPSITVYLPQKQYDELKIEQSTGEVTIPGDFTFQNITLSGSTGNARCYASVEQMLQINRTTGSIEVGDLTAGDIKLSLSTGQMDVVNVHCESLEMEVSTGYLKMMDVTCQSLATIGDTGDVTFINVRVEEKILVERTTGDLYLDRCDAKELKIVTDTGDVEGTLLSEKIFYVETDTGSVDVPKTVTGGLCEITTDTGDIKIEIVE